MKRILLLIPFLLFSCSPKTNQVAFVEAPAEFQTIRSEIIQLVKDGNIPSFSVAVLKDKKVIWTETFENIGDSTDVPDSSSAQYPIASLTKSMSATILLKLAEQGKISLDDPIDKYLPKQVNYYAREGASVKELLNMTAGIPHGWVYLSENSQYSELKNEKLLTNYGMSVFPKGTYEYSNYSYGIIEAIIETVSDKSYAEVVREELFDPVGMNSSFITTNDERKSDNFYPINELGNAAKFVPSAGAGVYSTIDDLIAYARLHLKEMDKALLSFRNIDNLHFDKTGSSTITALGWGSITLDENLTWLVSNGSFPNSANSNLTILPEEKIAVICLANKDFNSSADIMAIKIANILLPGFSDKAFAKMENYEASNRKDLKSNINHNDWHGTIKGIDSEVPISISYKTDGFFVALDNGDWQPVKYSSIDKQSIIRGGDLTVSLTNPITNQIEEAKADINLLIKENRLQGYLSARFIKENTFDISIPYYVIAE